MVVKKNMYIVCNIVSMNLFYSNLFRIKIECNDCCNDVPHYKAICLLYWLVVVNVTLADCQCDVNYCYVAETLQHL